MPNKKSKKVFFFNIFLFKKKPLLSKKNIINIKFEQKKVIKILKMEKTQAIFRVLFHRIILNFCLKLIL